MPSRRRDLAGVFRPNRCSRPARRRRRAAHPPNPTTPDNDGPDNDRDDHNVHDNLHTSTAGTAGRQPHARCPEWTLMPASPGAPSRSAWSGPLRRALRGTWLGAEPAITASAVASRVRSCSRPWTRRARRTASCSAPVMCSVVPLAVAFTCSVKRTTRPRRSRTVISPRSTTTWGARVSCWPTRWATHRRGAGAHGAAYPHDHHLGDRCGYPQIQRRTLLRLTARHHQPPSDAPHDGGTHRSGSPDPDAGRSSPSLVMSIWSWGPGDGGGPTSHRTARGNDWTSCPPTARWVPTPTVAPLRLWDIPCGSAAGCGRRLARVGAGWECSVRTPCWPIAASRLGGRGRRPRAPRSHPG